MIRRQYIEQIRRLIYGGMPADDATITVGLVNQWLNQAIGIAAKKNYTDSIQLDGISYVNNSFYTTFKSLTITKDEQFLFKVELPQIPLGIGANEGVDSMVLFDRVQNSYPIVWLTQNQRAFQRGMRKIPNKLLGYPEGKYVFILSTLLLTDFTAKATMVSGGDNTDLNSILNVPDDYIPTMTDYLMKQLMFERSVPVDNVEDGEDFIKTV